MKRRRKSQPKVFVVRDIHGKDWTTKNGLKLLRGIYAVDSKKYFYELKFYERVRKNEMYRDKC